MSTSSSHSREFIVGLFFLFFFLEFGLPPVYESNRKAIHRQKPLVWEFT